MIIKLYVKCISVTILINFMIRGETYFYVKKITGMRNFSNFMFVKGVE